MRRKKLAAFLVVATLAVASAPVVYARHRAADRGMLAFDGMGPFARMRWLKSELNLTDDQVNAIRAIARETHDQNRVNRKAIRANMIEVAGSLLDDPDDLGAATALLARQRDEVEAAKQNVLEGVAKAVTVLTPEQRQQLADILESRSEG